MASLVEVRRMSDGVAQNMADDSKDELVIASSLRRLGPGRFLPLPFSQEPSPSSDIRLMYHLSPSLPSPVPPLYDANTCGTDLTRQSMNWEDYDSFQAQLDFRPSDHQSLSSATDC